MKGLKEKSFSVNVSQSVDIDVDVVLDEEQIEEILKEFGERSPQNALLDEALDLLVEAGVIYQPAPFLRVALLEGRCRLDVLRKGVAA